MHFASWNFLAKSPTCFQENSFKSSPEWKFRTLSSSPVKQHLATLTIQVFPKNANREFVQNDDAPLHYPVELLHYRINNAASVYCRGSNSISTSPPRGMLYFSLRTWRQKRLQTGRNVEITKMSCLVHNRCEMDSFVFGERKILIWKFVQSIQQRSYYLQTCLNCINFIPWCHVAETC